MNEELPREATARRPQVERLTIRIAESDADVLLAGPMADPVRHGDALIRLRTTIRKARDNKGRMNL